MPDLRAPADERMAFPKAIRRLFQLRRASHRAGQGAAFCECDSFAAPASVNHPGSRGDSESTGGWSHAILGMQQRMASFKRSRTK